MPHPPTRPPNPTLAPTLSHSSPTQVRCVGLTDEDCDRYSKYACPRCISDGKKSKRKKLSSKTADSSMPISHASNAASGLEPSTAAGPKPSNKKNSLSSNSPADGVSLKHASAGDGSVGARVAGYPGPAGEGNSAAGRSKGPKSGKAPGDPTKKSSNIPDDRAAFVGNSAGGGWGYSGVGGGGIGMGVGGVLEQRRESMPLAGKSVNVWFVCFASCLCFPAVFGFVQSALANSARLTSLRVATLCPDLEP